MRYSNHDLRMIQDCRERELRMAATHGKLAELQACIASGVDVNTTDQVSGACLSAHFQNYK